MFAIPVVGLLYILPPGTSFRWLRICSYVLREMVKSRVPSGVNFGGCSRGSAPCEAPPPGFYTAPGLKFRPAYVRKITPPSPLQLPICCAACNRRLALAFLSFTQRPINQVPNPNREYDEPRYDISIRACHINRVVAVQYLDAQYQQACSASPYSSLR